MSARVDGRLRGPHEVREEPQEREGRRRADGAEDVTEVDPTPGPEPAAGQGGVKGLVARFLHSHLWRTWQNYGQRRGNTLASGLAFVGLFSVFGLLLTGFTVLAATMGSNTGLYLNVVSTVDSALPGLLDVGPEGGVVSPQDLVQSDALSWAGAIAFATALWAGLGWLDSSREGIRMMFDLPTMQANIAVKKLRDLGVALTLGVVIVSSAVVSLAVSALGSGLLGLVGLADSTVYRVVLQVLSVVVVLAVDALMFVVLFRLMSGLKLPWRDLRTGVLIGAVGLGVLKQLAGLLLGNAGAGNPILATGAVVVGLLVWLNLVSRVTLLAASWVASTIHEPVTQAALLADLTTPTRHAVTGDGGLPVALGPRDAMAPSFGQRSADRTAVAAGMVLGGLGLAAARVVWHGAVTVVRSARGR